MPQIDAMFLDERLTHFVIDRKLVNVVRNLDYWIVFVWEEGADEPHIYMDTDRAEAIDTMLFFEDDRTFYFPTDSADIA